ncbi:unnamed protein product, partial [Mesorhabditis belari]|uniref:Aquaporin n=1 Tax=Mesorhabditis belari TaxID=2138241 RepID=A0AAF3J719_9BILA
MTFTTTVTFPPNNEATSSYPLEAEEKGKMADEAPAYSIVSRCAAEFFGLVVFVFVGTAQALAGGGILNAALAHGITIFILIAAFGNLSGGHFNPAVTLGIAAVGRISPVHAVCYILSQLGGGFFGSLLAKLIMGDSFEKFGFGATIFAANVAWYQGLLAELFATFMLVQTVLMTAVDTGSNQLAPLAIGFTVAADILAIGTLTGASMNPGRSFGPQIVGALFHSSAIRPTNRYWALHWVYYLGPFGGAILAAVIYKVFYSRENRILK